MSLQSNRHSIRRRAALLSLVVGIGMLVGKWAAYWLTGSHAILSDALESVVHVAATAFALASIILAARPPDPKYPYGYGKIAYFSAGFEGGMIAIAALAILYEGVQGLIFGEELTRLDLGLILIGIASVVNLVLGAALVRWGKETESSILTADGLHVLTDAYTSFGVVAGVALVWLTGWNWLDSVIAIALGLNILWTGYGLVQESITGLMDRSDPNLLKKIVDAIELARKPGWLDIHELRAWQAGDRTFIDFHLVVPVEWTVEKLHDTNHEAEDILCSVLGSAQVIIHYDPASSGLATPEPWTVSLATRLTELGLDHDDVEVGNEDLSKDAKSTDWKTRDLVSLS